MTAALITGASSGIGLELARVFAEHKRDLVLVARRKAELDRLASELSAAHRVRVDVVEADLTKAGACRVVHERATDVDVLVNNAGYGLYGPLHTLDLDKLLDMVALNVTALTDLTWRYARDFERAGRGRILNVASTAAFQPGPLMAAYYATKAYVLSLTEGIREELKGSGVVACVLCPGPTKSGFQSRAGIEGLSFVNQMSATSEAVARAGYHGLMRGKAVIVPGLSNKLGVQAVRFTPRWLVRRIVKSLQST